MASQQAGAGGSLVVPLSGGERPGLTWETETLTEAIPGQQLFLPPWTQVPGAGRAGLKGKAGASRLCLCQGVAEDLAQNWAAPRRIMYSFNHHFPSACCVPGLEPEVKDTETDRAVPAWGVHGNTQHATEQQERGKYSVYISTEDRVGQSLPLTFRPTSPQEA